MMLINSLLTHATEAHWETFLARLDGLHTRRAVVALMSSHMVDDLTSCVLDFQANMARAMYRTKTTYVEPTTEPAHAAALRAVWAAARLDVERDDDGNESRWRQLGLASENVTREFGEVGVLGLHCLVRPPSPCPCRRPLTARAPEILCAGRPRVLRRDGA
jgi:engulfment/cell motility protein 1